MRVCFVLSFWRNVLKWGVVSRRTSAYFVTYEVVCVRLMKCRVAAREVTNLTIIYYQWCRFHLYLYRSLLARSVVSSNIIVVKRYARHTNRYNCTLHSKYSISNHIIWFDVVVFERIALCHNELLVNNTRLLFYWFGNIYYSIHIWICWICKTKRVAVVKLWARSVIRYCWPIDLLSLIQSNAI